MKKARHLPSCNLRSCFLLTCLLFTCLLHAQQKPFRFAFISDTHIGSPTGSSSEDLRRTVREINSHKDVAFVVLTGDITELGTNTELQLAKQILDSLQIPWYIIPGNHDTGWSESGGVMFSTIFGNDKFSFEYNGIRFLGCASGPYVRMSDGHVPRQALNWLDKQLDSLKPGQPVIFLNHYPIDESLDNWYEITDRLRSKNILAILCGHGHANKAMNFEDIPGVMGRSNLRAKDSIGGFNWVDVSDTAIQFTICKPGKTGGKKWTSVKIPSVHNIPGKEYKRPDFSQNSSRVKLIWSYQATAGIISSPAFDDRHVYAGNQTGDMICFAAETGNVEWLFKTGAAIFSSPALSSNNLVFGSADGIIYCLNATTGKANWKKATTAAVLGSPLVRGDTVFIGGSNHNIYAINIRDGKTIWTYDGLDGPVVSQPVWYDGKLILGAWDTYLYALDSRNGQLAWKWSNGSAIRNYSPAACTPVPVNGMVFVVAPDRYITAINATTGKTIWRNNDATVRESLGISANQDMIYGKTMQDTLVAYHVSGEKQSAAWKLNCHFGYEHVPSQLIEKAGQVYFGTRNGVVYAVDPVAQQVTATYKIDNSMVNTVRVTDSGTVYATTMDGRLVKLLFQ